jgi:hypothetical protein
MTYLTLTPRAAAVVDPLALLLDCHDRIRSFVATAARIASAPDVAPAQISDAAARVRRYFSVALPLHEQDEEQSIAPRLLRASPPAVVVDALGTMTAEHARLHELLAELDVSWSRLCTQPEAIAVLAPRLTAAQLALEVTFDDHLMLEETVVFPSAARLLAPDALRAIAAEIRARRTPEAVASHS